MSNIFNGKVNRVSKRIVAYIVILAILIQSCLTDLMPKVKAVALTPISMSGATTDLKILTNLQFVFNSAEVKNGQGGYIISGTTDKYGIEIGDTVYNNVSYASNSDIEVDLDGLNLGDSINVHKVGNGNYKVNFNAISGSIVEELVLDANSKAVINLNAPLTINKITLDAGASLTINSNGNVFSSEEISGGVLELNGSNYSIKNIAVDEFTANNAGISGAEGSNITATTSLTINNSDINTFDYVGYHNSVAAAKTIELSGTNNISNVKTFGAGIDAITYISGIDTLTVNNSSVVVDYRINYYDDSTLLEMENSWIASYRAKYTGAVEASNSEVVGYHLYSGEYTTSDPGLPAYTVEGMGYGGWTKSADGSGDSYTHADNTFFGDVDLYVKLIEGSVTVYFDLDYSPSQYSNDDYMSIDKVTYYTYQLGSTIELEKPVRFGYEFTGWKVTTGTLNGLYNDHYVVAATDATDEIVELKAQWKKKTYPVRFLVSVDSDFDINRVKVTVGDKVYDSISEFASQYSHVIWNATDSMIQFDTNIEYEESFSDFFSRVGLEGMPVLSDSVTGVGQMDFNGWHTSTGAILSSDMLFEMGSLLSKSESQTLVAYDEMISLTPVFVTSGWGIASFTLTTDLPIGWEVLVDGVAVTDKTTSVESGATLTWRYSTAVKTNFSYWAFSSTSGAFVVPQETAYNSKNTHISFTTTMPNGNVTASFSDANVNKNYIDLSKAPITFAEGVKAPSGRTVNGFWYDFDMTTMKEVDRTYLDSDKVLINVNKMAPLFYDEAKGGYFYEYITGVPAYITSCEKATTNQVTIINTSEVYFRDINMVARPEYSANFVGRKAYNTLMELVTYSSTDLVKNNTYALNNKDWSECGNIVISNQINKMYTTKLRYQGDNNTVASIILSKCNVTSEYAIKTNSLYLYGDDKNNTSLELGNITYFGCVYLYELTVNEYDNTKHPDNPDNSEYLVYTATSQEGNDITYIRGCNVNAKNKRLYNSFGYIYVERDNTKTSVSSDVFIGSAKYYYLHVRYNSYMRVYGDLYGMRGPIYMNENASLVVDGNIYSRYSSGYNSAYSGDMTLASAGYLIVKGNTLSGTNFNKTGAGVVITNAVSGGRAHTMSNGYLVTNQLTNVVYQYGVLNTNGYFTYPLVTNSTVTAANAATNTNGDNYPFANVSYYYAANNTYTWSGANTYTYLLGDYNTGISTYDNQSILWSEETGYTDNAVAKVLQKIDVLDENGDLKEEYRGKAVTDAVKTTIRTTAGSVYEEQVAEYGDYATRHENITYGNTKFTGETGTLCRKDFSITGGYIYSAGNITFRNDAKITGGTIVCGGTLASKHDLTVSGGTITAKEVGNACQVITDVNDKISRYSLFTITKGTINTDKLGATTFTQAGFFSKSTIIVDGSFTLKKYDGSQGEVDVCDNIKVNYIFSDNYKCPSTNTLTTEYTGKVSTGTISGALTGLTEKNAFVLDAPIGSPPAVWKYDSSSGTLTEQVTLSGYLNSDDAAEYLYNNKEYAAFYATKESYNLIFKEGYDDYYLSSSFGGQAFNFNVDSKTKEYTAEVPADVDVVLQLTDPSMYDKTVVWYFDDSNILHNAMPTCTSDGKIVFKMPSADTEVYVTNTLSLYLDLYNISMIEDGFAVELPSSLRRADSVFDYKGNLLITQKQAAATYNEMYWEAGSDNLVDDEVTRTVTLKGVKQLIGSGNGTTIADNTKVQFNFLGENTMAPVKLPATSKVVFKGDSRNTETLNFSVLQSFEDYRFVGNASAATGDVVFSDMKINSSTSIRIVKGTSTLANNNNTVSFVNVDFKRAWSSGNNIIYYSGQAVIDNCNFDIGSGTTSYTSYPFYTKGDVTIKNGSTINYSYGGTQSGYPIWYYVGGKFIIDDSEVSSTIYQRSATDTYIYSDYRTGKIVLNNGKFTTGEQTYLVSLELNGNSELNIGKNQDGYLLCRDIVVNDDSTINAGYVVVSGYTTTQYNSQTVYDAANSNLGNFINGNSYPGLVVNGGTVNASEFVGGDYNGKVTVNGGAINAKRIGTIGERYGFKYQIPFKDKFDHVYVYKTTPIKATVTLNDGTITVLEGGYLGGINGVVDLKGGEVVLEGNAVIGITEDQLTEAEYLAATTGTKVVNPTTVKINNATVTGSTEGGINTPYSELNITGEDTAIKVNTITAKNGTINIKDANGAFENPYDGQEIRKPEYVGVLVNKELSASNIYITDGTSVYAYTAYARGDEEGKGGLYVETADGGLLSAPGAFGEENITDDTLHYDSVPNSLTQTIFGIRQVTITYELNPEEIVLEDDVESIVNDNVSGYVVTSIAESIEIKDAECKGYYFRGWYTDPEFTTPAGNAFNTSLANNITLYAKWEKINVKFNIMIDSSSTSYSLEGEFDQGGWTENADGSYTAEEAVYINYGSNVIGTEGVVYGHFNTTTLGITSLEYKKDVYGDEVYTGPTSINASTLVTKEIAEFYKKISNNGEDTDAAIVIHVSGVQKRFASITFSLNKKDGRPADAAFETVATTTLQSNAPVDDMIGTVPAFAGTATDTKSPGLLVPKATGYTFIGWNTSEDATADSVEGWITGEDYLTTSTTIYAVWSPNKYLVRFSAGEGKWVTEDNTVPAVEDAEVKYLDYYWIYDTPVTADNSFWLISKSSEDGMSALPYAWREGFKFDTATGWTYSYTDATGTTRTNHISSTHELSEITIRALDSSIMDPSMPAITFVAEYTPVKIKYELNGGEWKDSDTPNEVELEYNAPLAGYLNAEINTAAGETLTVPKKTAVNGLDYIIISTTGEYFLANYDENNNADNLSGYTERDYRRTLSNKGYSFYGWYESKEEADLAGALVSDTITQDQIDAAINNAVATTPRFEDITVYASWHANSYFLDLYSYDYDSDVTTDPDKKLYNYNKFNMPETSSTHVLGVDDSRLIKVTTGEEINDTSNNWPSRNGDWYAYNDDVDHANIKENEKRFLLGFTFVPLDPGSSLDPSLVDNPTEKQIAGFNTYKAYAGAVLNMQNEGTLFQNREQAEEGIFEGTDFYLPDDEAYNAAISGTTFNMNSSVPDYPDGSIVKLYAVYRERSLVFVEQYVDNTGEVVIDYLDAYPWQYWSDFADNYGDGNPDILNKGYALIGWYINGTSTSAAPYPMIKDTYDPALDNFEVAKKAAVKKYEDNATKYKDNAIALGTNDIFVYTIYVAQIENEITFDSVEMAKDESFDSDSYTLPNSMQNGYMSLVITNPHGDVTEKLNIVSKADMLAHQYDTEWTADGKTYTANDTVAIELVLSREGDEHTYSLTEEEIETGLQISSGWETTLNFYHSKVISESNSYELLIQMNFDNSVGGSKNTLGSQFVKDTVYVNLAPVKYTVNYKVNFPEELAKLVDVELNDYEEDGTYTDVIGYGSDLTTEVPTFEGYKPLWIVGDGENNEGWTYTNDEKYKKLVMPVDSTNNGEVDITLDYVAEKYKLSADEETLNHWDITYSDGAGASDITSLSGTDQVEVKYHSDIKFTPKPGTQVPEYITLNITDSSNKTEVIKLPAYADKVADDYVFVMPAANVDADFITVETLYLDDGTIEITATGYTQNGVEHTWTGDYVILQCADNNSDNHTTANVLKLDGDLSERKIEVGNLNITTPNSIELSPGAKADITAKYNETESTITAKNILVPEGASFAAENGTYKLNPAINTAAIGANAASPVNGDINLTGVNVKMNLPAGSAASGIGSGTQDATKACGSVTISGSVIEAAEIAGTSAYTGAWIGGNGVSTVVIDNSTVKRLDNSTVHAASPNTISGKTVEINKSSIGTADSDPVYNPIFAENKLDITDSDVFIMIQDNLANNATAKAPIGTAISGVINVNESEISVTKAGGTFEELYTGMMILDVKSDVTISNNQILDVANGDINITGTGFTQGSEELVAHTGNYVLIGEKPVTDAADVVVDGLGNNATITVKQPTSTSVNASAAGNAGVEIDDLLINTNATINVNSDVIIDGKADVADKTLTIKDDEKSEHTISFSDGSEAFNSSTGIINISDVNIKSSADDTVGCDNVDINLSNSDANVGSLIAKDLVIDGGVIKAANEVGSHGKDATTVEIKGGAEIEAITVGALGEHNSTFTTVTVSDDSTINGKLVQDWYRITYDKSSLDIDVTALDVVFRTETAADGTVTSLPLVPDNPTGTDVDLFVNWYVWSTDGESRIAITEDTGELAPGLSAKDVLKNTTSQNILADDVTLNSDGTYTIVLHAWVNASGTIVVKSGRLFTSFTGSDSVSIDQTGAYSIYATSTGNSISGRDYKLTFGENQPVGTDVTLTTINSDGTKSFYYYKFNTSSNTVKFSDFKEMGSHEPLALEDTDGTGEEFVIAVDYSETNMAKVTDMTVKLDILPTATTSTNIGDAVKVTTTEVVPGEIEVNASDASKVSVSVDPSGKADLSGKNIYLVAELDKPVLMGSSIKVGDIEGTWIALDTAVFEIGTYGTAASINDLTTVIENAPAGDYNITWSIVYGDNTKNILGNVISVETAKTGKVTVAQAVEPILKVVDDVDTVTVLGGDINYTYETNASVVKVRLEKQNAFGIFVSVGDEFTASEGSCKLTIPDDNGVYRAIFSINDDTNNDNVYFSYIVD